jgi:metal-sulfur cluster biosynthetic enzyme
MNDEQRQGLSGPARGAAATPAAAGAAAEAIGTPDTGGALWREPVYLRLEASPAPPAPPASAVDERSGVDTSQVWDALRTVLEPELGMDVVTLGLVYDVAEVDGTIRITFTLTKRGSPLEEFLTAALVHAGASVRGVRSVEADLVWEPPWHPGMMRGVHW